MTNSPQKQPKGEHVKEILLSIKRAMGAWFNLMEEKEAEEETVNNIRAGVEFKGANLSILVLAIFIASLGLNTNSAAVIIGAMLISPLMGPIIGMGLGVGIYDFELFKRAFRNYLRTTLFSIATATIYFFLTPIDTAQSELLARTSPTIYDVFIALCGGLAGIIALSTTHKKGNVIPGVAIATALMPPLCTAGFGLATGNLRFAIGAFYLYLINTIFISFATFIGVNLMHFKKKKFVDEQRGKKVRRYIMIVAVVTMLPSTVITFNMVKQTFYEQNVNRFLTAELNFPNTQIVTKHIDYSTKTIKVVLLGREVPKNEIQMAQAQLAVFGLEGSTLQVLQGSENIDVKQMKEMLANNSQMSEREKDGSALIAKLQSEINNLKEQVTDYEWYDTLSVRLLPEMHTLFPQVSVVSVCRSVEATMVKNDSLVAEPLLLTLVQTTRSLTPDETTKLQEWVRLRLSNPKAKLLVVKLNEAQQMQSTEKTSAKNASSKKK